MEKNENEDRKQNTGIVLVGGLILPALSLLVSVIGLENKLLNIILFVVMAIVCVVILWGLPFYYFGRFEKKVKYEYEEKILNRNKKNDSDIENIETEIRENKRRFNRECREEKISFMIKSVSLSLVFFANIGLLLWQLYVKSEDVKVGLPDYAESNPGNSAPTYEDEEKSNDGITPEQKAEMKNKTFILNDPERLIVLSKGDENKVFYITNVNETEIEEEVTIHVKDIFSKKKNSTVATNSVEEYIIFKVQEDEDVFLQDIENASYFKSIENYEAWVNTIPHSDKLETIMNDREWLWMSQNEDMMFSGTVWFRLANSNQLLSKEYMLQGGAPETVIYYYVQSIIWVERGLAYEDLPEGYQDKYYNYIKARYRDIGDYIENNLERFGVEQDRYRQIEEKAYAIYKAM